MDHCETCKQEYETIDELAARTKMKKSWWYSRTRETGPDAVPRIRCGRYLLFIPGQVDQWLQGQQSR